MKKEYEEGYVMIKSLKLTANPLRIRLAVVSSLALTLYF